MVKQTTLRENRSRNDYLCGRCWSTHYWKESTKDSGSRQRKQHRQRRT